MALLNYTSTVPASQSIAEIQERLSEYGADTVTVTYTNREPAMIQFALSTPRGRHTYCLPANVDAVEGILFDTPRATRTRAQAVRTAWRNIRDWINSQLALIAAEQASIDQVLLPWRIEPDGRSHYDAYTGEPDLILLPEHTT